MSSMLLCRACNARTLQISILKKIPRKQISRKFTDGPKDDFHNRTERRSTLKERALAPPGENAFKLGKGAVIAGGVIGMAALCFYGLGLSGEPGALEKSMVWPQYVKDRIRTTYMYFGSTIAISAASASLAFQSPFIMNIVLKNGFIGFAISTAAIIGTGLVAQIIEYKPGFGAKQVAWLLHASVMGAMLAPICALGGPILIRAGWYTAGIIGGLSTIALCAPSERFLMMAGPLAMGLGVVVASSIGNMFFPPTTGLGAGLMSMSLYGGLLLFAGFLLFDTQLIIAVAEQYPPYPVPGLRPYDPINSALAIYMDALNIFIRIVTIIASNSGNNK